ncbi:MAG: DEAD/DEAH box helicase [Candidatus Lokiarchaeota archaeon]|nr:DEAD/DEAH box helicase [Candidatus Lokiarchaeota archaeon]
MSDIKNDIQEEKTLEKKNTKNQLIEYRKYQVEIADKCAGKNSLVVLPTGLGKTVIAVLVALKTLTMVPAGSKIIILAPTRPLINQHYESFSYKLQVPEDRFGILTGKIPPEKRLEIFKNRQVLFYTPQTLRNDLVSNRYALKKVCLLVIDEAHHASGDYPYILIADKFLEQNSDGFILALTASPGSTKEKILTLCESLHVPVENIHIRSRKDNDVKSYLKPMDIFKIGVERTQLMEDSVEAIEQILEERLIYLAQNGFISKESSPLTKKVLRKDLVKLNSDLIDILRGEGEKTGSYGAISVNAQALILYHMIELVEQQGLDVLLEYLEKLRSDARKKNSSKAVKILASNQQIRRIFIDLQKCEDFTPEKLIHPKYHVLENYLRKELQSSPELKILVFVKLRNSVLNIVEKLNKIQSIKAARFVGQATKSKKDTGLSQKTQIQILDDFKRGKYNILVATNVAEEGLDIVECDLVIFYDVVASEIRLIQRKGRTARHRKGRVLILYTKNSKDEIYLNIALNRLKKMNYNLKNSNRILNESIGTSSQNQIDFNASSLVNISGESNISEGQGNVRAKIHKYLDIGTNTDISKNNIKGLKGSKQFSLEDFTIKAINKNPIMLQADFTISKNLPMRWGLRKKLGEWNMTHIFVESQEHVVIGKNVLVQIYPAEDIELFDVEKFNEVSNEKYELVLNILDFSEFKEKYEGHKRSLKRAAIEFSEKSDLRIICVDDHEELFFILRNVHEQKINDEEKD